MIPNNILKSNFVAILPTNVKKIRELPSKKPMPQYGIYCNFAEDAWWWTRHASGAPDICKLLIFKYLCMGMRAPFSLRCSASIEGVKEYITISPLFSFFIVIFFAKLLKRFRTHKKYRCQDCHCQIVKSENEKPISAHY